jgi:nucleoside-diphosphate-sugar epimerase/predicted dehydrogenase
MRAFRIALIGCGAAAAPYLAALRRLGVRPALFVDADPAAAQSIARGAPVAAAPEQALDRFDAAIVTGIGAGSTSALRALAPTGKPILCAPEALAAAACGGARPPAASSLTAASHLRFAPGAERVRSLLQDERLGSITSFDVRFGASPLAAARSVEYWDRRVAGGGVLVDPGVHVLDLLAWWIGPLGAASFVDDSDGGVEAEALAHIAAGGATGIVELSRLRTLRNTIALTGTRGKLELDLETFALRAEPESLARDGDTRVAASLRGDRAPESLHRRRIEEWLRACTSASGSPAESLIGGNAIDTLGDLYARRERFFHGWEQPSEERRGDSSLAGRAVLVTGATGFIGARLVEKLVAERARITVAVRNPRRAARIARCNARLVAADLESASDLDALTRGQEIVFSLAYDLKRSGAANVAVHRGVAEACARARVRRFVHLSSIAVYDDWPSGSLDESSPRDGPGSEYKAAKRAMEIDLAERAATGALASTVLQPTIVYGPFGSLWTDRFVERLRVGKVEIPRDGLGLCNGVYVDDVVDALIAAAREKEAAGQTYIISGADAFEWTALIAGYADALGATLDYGAAPAPGKSSSALGALGADPLALARLRPARWLLGFLRERIGDERLEKLRDRIVAARRRAGPLVYRPAEEDPRLYFSRGHCSIAKARRDLNYAPAFDLEEGLNRTRNYIRWRYLGASWD